MSLSNLLLSQMPWLALIEISLSKCNVQIPLGLGFLVKFLDS